MTDTTAAPAATPDAPAAPAPGSPEYDAAMAALFRSSQEGASPLETKPEGQAPPADDQTPTRPANVPEKFWDADKGQVRVEDLLKSYTELESKGGQKPAQPQTPVDPNAPADPNAGDGAAAEAVQAAGLKWDDLGSKITTTGDIEASDYEALARAGIPKDIVQTFIENRKIAGDALRNAAYEYGGGKEAVDGVLGWASKSLTPAEVEGYNKMLGGPSWKAALDTLKGLHAKANPTANEPNLVTVNGAGAGSPVGYTSPDQMQADMRNPLYFEMSPKGEVYRQQVSEKVRLASYRQ